MYKFILLLVIVSAAFSQDYRISQKQYAHATAKPRYEFSFTYPEIRGFSSNVTAMNMFNKHIWNIVTAMSDTFNVWMRDWDTVSMSPEARNEMGSYYETGDSVFYASNKLISVQFYEGSYFAGSVHPNNSSFTVNYDLENIKELTLNDILKPGWVNKISEICIKSLMKQLYDDKPEHDDWVTEGAGPKESNFDVFNITKEGIVITFVTYQVASYANGPSEVFIPYSDLKDMINPARQLNTFVK